LQGQYEWNGHCGDQYIHEGFKYAAAKDDDFGVDAVGILRRWECPEEAKRAAGRE
jgi:hypothetical protein